MSDLWRVVGVMAYLSVLAAITVVAVAFVVAERWQDWRQRWKDR